jgi:5-formyltetrahydrofolate cyclo-ligase
MEKPELRQYYKELRQQLPIATVAALNEASPQAAATLTQYKVIGGYYPIGHEASPLPLLQQLAMMGIAIALPRIKAAAEPLAFHAWQRGDMLATSSLNIPEPLAEAAPLSPEALLVPLLAFDGKGNRLGYGGGFYDRTIQSLRSRNTRFIAIGIAYDAQQAARLPAERHDQRLDAVITESGFRWLGIP